ncbi:hypothetical protein QJS10_CPA06g02084 [Acorus calamus]|uniref:Uncharacterized protein n=1 Tax=Acorus calamus TaxID=4465 RepID=A0AAV9EPH5_ACOCL|nr:hypothetical protein QJS10_CPA06g02084 [Acorus calamus]
MMLNVMLLLISNIGTQLSLECIVVLPWQKMPLAKWNDGEEGKLDDAENHFSSALQEAREGFEESDPRVASSCNNLS